MTALKRLLLKHGACKEAVAWASAYKTLPEAWEACERGDWMLWLAAKDELCTRQELVLAACACARLALPYVHAGERRPLRAIETGERWARGEATLDEVRAYAAAYAADDAAAAAYAAAYAAVAAADDAAAAAAAAAAVAAAAYAAAAARTHVLKQCADIVRERIKVSR